MSKGIGCVVAVVVLVVVLLVAGLGVMGINNRLVGLEQGVDAQWAQVESAYQRRADLIPNLVATVRGSADFERGTLEAITEARASVGRGPSGPDVPDDPQAFAQWQAAQAQLSGALSRLMVVVERYPDLKASQAFRDLMVQLEGTENRVNVERVRFNEVARDYNTDLKRFPTVFIGRMLGFRDKAYFTAAAGADQAPQVQFDFGSPTAPAPPVAGSPAPTASPR